jgi:hypothetical protein
MVFNITFSMQANKNSLITPIWLQVSNSSKSGPKISYLLFAKSCLKNLIPKASVNTIAI